MNSIPRQRLSRAKALADGSKHWGLVPQIAMAVHANLSRWDAGARRRLDRLVAIAAIQTNIPNMMSMAEWNQLLHGNVLLSNVG